MPTQQERVQLLLKLKENPKQIPLVKRLVNEDMLYWFDWFATTYDPRVNPITKKPNGPIPFNLYPYQREFVTKLQQKIRNGEDLLVEKSRDMGVSWMVLSVFYYEWLTTAQSSFLVGSRNINEVDKKGNISTLFEKVRLLLYNTPAFLRPINFQEHQHSSFCRLVNPHNQSVIIGETGNQSFGRGGRHTAAMMDEHAFWPFGDAAWESLGQTTPCRISVSTPNGSANRFAKMALKKIPDCPEKVTMYWHFNPTHTQEWYELQKTRYTKSGLAREVDISYALSIEGKVFEMFDPTLHVKPLDSQNSKNKLWVPNPNLPIIIAFDFGRDNATVFLQVDNYYNIDVFHEIVLANSSTEEQALAARALVQQYNSINPINQPYEYRFTADPNGQSHPWQKAKSGSMDSVHSFSDYDVLKQHDFAPMEITRVLKNRSRLREGISLLQTVLNTRFQSRERLLIQNPDKCPILIQALQGEYRYKSDKNGDILDVVHEAHPYEDVVDCLRYAALQFAGVLPDENPRNRRGVVKSPYVFTA